VILATWQELVIAAPAAFLLGLGVGWIVSQRYSITRRNGEGYGRRDEDYERLRDRERRPDDR
jgi:hypothetical protein